MSSQVVQWVLDTGFEHYKINAIPSALIEYASDSKLQENVVNPKSATPNPNINSSDKPDDYILLNNQLISNWLIDQLVKVSSDLNFEFSDYNKQTSSTGRSNNPNSSNINGILIDPLVRTTKLDNGLIRYNVSNIHGNIQHLIDIINIVSYKPLIIQVDDFPKVKYDPSIEHETANQHNYSTLIALRDWRELCAHILQREMKRNIVKIIQLDDNNFQPVDYNGSPIYVLASEIVRVRMKLKLEQYYGWKYLTDNGLVELALTKLKDRPNYIQDKSYSDSDTGLPMKHVYGVYLIPFTVQYKNLSSLIKPMITSMVANGFKSIELSNKLRVDNNMLNMAFELLSRFGYKIIKLKSYESYTGMQGKGPESSSSNVNQSNPLQAPKEIIVKAETKAYRPASLVNWLMDSISLIMENQLPYVMVQCRHPLMSYSKIEERKAITWYIALEAYIRLIDKYPYLSTSIYRINVNDDLSINIPLSSRFELEDFNVVIDSIVDDFVPGSWNIFETNKMRDAVIYRWVLYHKYDTRSIAFQLPMHTNNKPSDDTQKPELTYYVVTNRHIEPQILNEFRSRIRNDQLSKYLSDINDSINTSFNMSAILSESIKQTSIDELSVIMNYVPIIDLGNNQQSVTLQMINRDVFLRSTTVQTSNDSGNEVPYSNKIFNIFVNPITRRPITRTSLSRIITYIHGLLGWFNIGGNIEGYTPNNTVFIPGLLKDPPVRFLQEINQGQIEINGLLPKDSYEDEFVMSVRVKLSVQCRNLSSLVSSSERSVTASAGRSSDVSSSNVNSIESDVNSDLNSELNSELKIEFGSINVTDRTIPLFDLAYNRIPTITTKSSNKEIMRITEDETKLMTQFNSLVAWLWKKGWFLSLWTTAVIYKENIQSKLLSCADSSYAYPLDDVLKYAATSAHAGKWAIQYLNLIVQTL